MGKIKDKIYDWKDRLRDRKMMSLVIGFVIIIIAIGLFAYKKQRDYRQLADNQYNNAFYQLVEYSNNIEKLLAKSTISNSPKHGVITLTEITKESALAQTYLARLPIATQNLENTNKFLNQVGDYCYSLERKNISGQNLSQEDLDNLTQLHEYSLDMKNMLSELENEIYSGTIKWGDLEKKGNNILQNESDNLAKTSFGSIEEDLHQYAGLIYDGAFSENQENGLKKAIVGNEINEEEAEEIAKKFIGEDKTEKVTQNSEGSENNSSIDCYKFNVQTVNKLNYSISVSKIGGKVVLMNCNRTVENENITADDAVKIGRDFLTNRGYTNMRETYYMDNENILTVNYAYQQDQVIVYPDLIKVKIAMDNGEILGMEATKYLNSHEDNRDISSVKITEEQAKKLVNPKLELKSTNLAIIPTEWNTEILCWELKGRTEDNDFLVYINAKTGEEEDILMIINSDEGTVTT
jgi:germination protein YpeB